MENKNGGALFRNKKEKPTQPDYSGTGEFNGIKFKISGWVNVSKAGMKYQRLIFTEIVEQPVQDINQEAIQTKAVLQGSANEQLVDDLPF